MKKLVITSVLLAAGTVAFAQESARVISSTPIVTQVAVPRQVCTNQQVVVQGSQTGVGALTGFALGGAVGNRFGGGDGRAAATALGAIGGAILGNQIESQGAAPRVENVQNCQVQTSYENRTTGYTVVYEYAGRRYTTQTETDPGAYVQVQVAPVSQVSYNPVVQYQQPVYVSPVYVAPAAQYVYPSRAYGWHHRH